MELDQPLRSTEDCFSIPCSSNTLENLSRNGQLNLRDKLLELVSPIDKKLNYKAHMYQVSHGGENVLALVPLGSNMVTALIGWDDYHERYEIKSKRIWREKYIYDMRIFGGYAHADVSTSKSKSKVVNMVCNFRSYSDHEVYAANAESAWYEANEACGKTAKEYKALERRWCQDFCSSEAKDILHALDNAHKTDTQLTLDSNSNVMNLFRKHKQRQAELEEKLAYVGNLAPVFLIKQKQDEDRIVLLAKNPASDWKWVSFPHTKELPKEMLNKLVTLSTMNSTETVDGVGARIDPIVCAEACWLAVSEELREEMLAEGKVIYAD